MTQVFLSHSTIDAEFAAKLAADLRAAGIAVWKAPESILPGEVWVDAIQRGLNSSTHLVLLMSPAAVESKWVSFEFQVALDRRMRDLMRIIPVEYQSCAAPDFWRALQAIPVFEEDYSANVARLMDRLAADKPANPPAPADISTTINVTIHGGVSGVVNIAGGDVTYVGQPGMAPVHRPGYKYYGWASCNQPQEIFFAGRSVLHRIDAGLRHANLSTAETVIAQKLSEGSKLRLMFLDPRSNLIPRLAKEGGEAYGQLLGDLATSIGICERLYNRLKDGSYPQAFLEILLYDEVPYFAYHQVDEKVIVGFYFSTAVDYRSGAYEVIDEQTKKFFTDHFNGIRAKTGDKGVLLQIPEQNDKVILNEILLEEVKQFLCDELG